MTQPAVRAVLDANVLFPFTLRDTLLRVAAAGYFQLYWSDEILDETSRNLVATGTITAEQAEHLIKTMTRAFPESMVEDYESLMDAMPNDEKDRHVAAAAVKAGAEIIVTHNLRDFQMLPEGIEGQSPDDFLLNLLDFDPEGIVNVMRMQAAALTRPPRTFDELIGGLSRSIPRFVEAVRSIEVN